MQTYTPRMIVWSMRLTILCCLAVSAPFTRASVYQWSMSLGTVTSPETKNHPRAFLWIPDQCKHVRAVVIADTNMEEEQIFQNEAFRKTLSDLGFAEIWISPSLGPIDFRFDQDVQPLLTTLKGLADQSGYQEIEFAPLVPMGHSATASWGWDIAAWNPQRTLAVLSISGQWPYFSAKSWGDRSVDQVPGLTTKGEYEIGGSLETGWYAGLGGNTRTTHPYQAFTQVVDPGDGHFGASKEKIDLINLFLRKAAQYRLPAEDSSTGPVTLKPMNARVSGWLYDVWHRDAPPSSRAAPVGKFAGKKEKAFWAFDEEMAGAIETFQGRFRNEPAVLIGYQQKDGLTAPRPDHGMVHLKFEPIEDGMTLKLAGAFWDNVPPTPDGKPAEWDGWLGEGAKTITQGEPIPHPQDEQNLFSIYPICGPVLQTAPDTFQIRFGRIGFDNPKRANDIWLCLNYAGDGKYKKMAQQAELQFPLKNTHGEAQQIDFPKVPDQIASDSMLPIKLNAVSTAHVPVHYYVREGPAEVDEDGTLHFTAIPPRSKFPVAVTVVAWQWGRSINPQLQSANPMERSFYINATR